MRKKIMSLTTVSMFKFIGLILLYFLIIYFLENAKTGGKVLIEIVTDVLNQTTIENQVIYNRAKWVMFFYKILKNFGLYVFGLGVVLNIVVDIVVDKTKNKPAIIVLGIVKLLTFSYITGILSIVYGARLDKSVETKTEMQNEGTNLAINKPNNNTPQNNRGYHHPVYRCSALSLIGAIVWYGAVIVLFVYVTAVKKISISQFMRTMWLIEFALLFVGTYTLLGFRNKRRCFIKSYKNAKKGMCVEEVQNIMRLYPVTDSGYTSDQQYVLEYRIKRGRQYELVRFIFFNNMLINYNIAYKRIISC